MGEMAEVFAKAHDNLAALQRESADRRALRESKVGQAEKEAREALLKQAAISQRFAEHRAELGRRSREAGGWQTSSAMRDRSGDMRLGFDGDEEPREDQFASYRPPVSAPPQPPQPVEPPPVAPPAPAAPPRGRRPAARRADDDDDDMSGQSWMR